MGIKSPDDDDGILLFRQSMYFMKRSVLYTQPIIDTARAAPTAAPLVVTVVMGRGGSKYGLL